VKWLRLAAWIALSTFGSGLSFAAALALGRILGRAGVGRDLDSALLRGLFVLLLCFGTSVAFEIAGRITGYGRSRAKYWIFALIVATAMIGWWTAADLLLRALPISGWIVFLITAGGMLGLAWIGERFARRLGISFSRKKGPA
jgi:hypothetical protein